MSEHTEHSVEAMAVLLVLRASARYLFGKTQQNELKDQYVRRAFALLVDGLDATNGGVSRRSSEQIISAYLRSRVLRRALCDEILSSYPDRTRDVIWRWVAAKGENRQRLEDIGARHGVTRERIRQIASSVVGQQLPPWVKFLLELVVVNLPIDAVLPRRVAGRKDELPSPLARIASFLLWDLDTDLAVARMLEVNRSLIACQELALLSVETQDPFVEGVSRAKWSLSSAGQFFLGDRARVVKIAGISLLVDQNRRDDELRCLCLASLRIRGFSSDRRILLDCNSAKYELVSSAFRKIAWLPQRVGIHRTRFGWLLTRGYPVLDFQEFRRSRLVEISEVELLAKLVGGEELATDDAGSLQQQVVHELRRRGCMTHAELRVTYQRLSGAAHGGPVSYLLNSPLIFHWAPGVLGAACPVSGVTFDKSVKARLNRVNHLKRCVEFCIGGADVSDFPAWGQMLPFWRDALRADSIHQRLGERLSDVQTRPCSFSRAELLEVAQELWDLSPRARFDSLVPELRHVALILRFSLLFGALSPWSINMVLGRKLNDPSAVSILCLLVVLGLVEPRDSWMLGTILTARGRWLDSTLSSSETTGSIIDDPILAELVHGAVAGGVRSGDYPDWIAARWGEVASLLVRVRSGGVSFRSFPVPAAFPDKIRFF